MNSKGVQTTRQGIRRLPGWRIAAMIRRSPYTQTDIARLAGSGAQQSDVSKAIYRGHTGPHTERIWAVLEEKLGPQMTNGHGGSTP